MKERIKQVIKEAVNDLFGIHIPEPKVEKPRDEKLGDLATNISFLLAKELKKSPSQIAEEISSKLSDRTEFERVEAVKGFVNFRISRELLLKEFSHLLRSGEDYFREDIGKGQKVQLEFVSANPTGPLHLGHGRGAVVGDTLARIMSFFGFDVVREYYINDAGRQVYLLGVSIFYRYLQLLGKEDRFPEVSRLFEEEGYKGNYVIELAESLKEAVGDLLLFRRVREARERLLKSNFPFSMDYTEGLEPSRTSEIELCSSFGLDAMMYQIKQDLKNMGVEFNTWFSERSLYEKGLVEDMINNLIQKGFTYEKDGALWLRTSLFGDDKDRVLRKSDGSYTYFASDIAYHWDKFSRGFERVINFWGADHYGYIPRVKASLKMLGISEDWLEVYLIQMVKLFKGGKEVRMSKRSGQFVTLRELIEDVGPDAIRFVFLTKRSDTPLDFDIDLVKEKSSENPVFYVQYAHARISGVFREFRERFGQEPALEEMLPHLNGLKEEEERNLIKKSLLFKDELIDIVLRRDPHLITYYLLDLASSFHRYYNRYRVIGSNKELLFARMALLRGIKECLRVGLKLIGVSAPDRM